jgi:hypothetical protein
VDEEPTHGESGAQADDVVLVEHCHRVSAISDRQGKRLLADTVRVRTVHFHERRVSTKVRHKQVEGDIHGS